MCVCRRARVQLSHDLWSGLSRRHRELNLWPFFFHCNTNFFFLTLLLSVFYTHSACTQLARLRSNPQNGGSGEARRPPLLGTRHPWCQECQLREWRGDERKGGREVDRAGKVWLMQRVRGRKRCGGERNRKRIRGTKMRQERRGKERKKGKRPLPSSQFIPPQRQERKELIGLRDRMQG